MRRVLLRAWDRTDFTPYTSKTVQGILGHERIQTTLDLYTDKDLDEMIAAQEKFLDAVGFESGSAQ
jgi:integrase